MASPSAHLAKSMQAMFTSGRRMRTGRKASLRVAGAVLLLGREVARSAVEEVLGCCPPPDEGVAAVKEGGGGGRYGGCIPPIIIPG